MKIKQPIALVSGASSGIGEATAQRLATAAYKVYGTSRRVRAVDKARLSFPNGIACHPWVRKLYINEYAADSPLTCRAVRSCVKSFSERKSERCPLVVQSPRDPSNATFIVGRLEKAGYARREVSTEDGRVKLVFLTESGAATREELMREYHDPPKQMRARRWSMHARSTASRYRR